jgi:hypothetical protein
MLNPLKWAPMMSKRIVLLSTFCLLLPLLLAPACNGQVFTASVSGIVKDPSGAEVPGATVRLRNTSTNDARSVNSAGDGRYTFSQLSPGTYELTVEAKGFRSFVQPQLTLNASQAAEFNVPLTIGDATQRVEVAAAAPVLDTQSADKSVTLSGQSIVDLPTSVRNPLVLVWQTAGVVAIRTGVSTSVNEQNQNRFALNGGRDESAAILIDGVPSTAGDWGGVLATPSIEAIQEVQVLRNSYDVQYGRTDGGVVSMVTKSGSPAFHGNVYDYLRNNVLDANTWDRNRAGLPRSAFQRNQFGGALGGPIINSKHLYFFGDFEELRDSTPGSFLNSVPTALERQGDFSQSFNSNGSLAVIYNPFSTTYNPANATYSRVPFAGNLVPANLINPIGQKTASLYPQPNLAGSPLTHALNFAAGGKNIDINKRFDARVDWAKSEHFSLFTRVTKAWEDTIAPTYLGNNIDSNFGGHNPRHQVVIASTWVPTPTWVTNILVGTGRWREVQLSPSQGHDATALGFSPAFASQLSAETIPQFSISNYAQISNARYLSDPRTTNNLQINNSKQLGNHGLKFGFISEVQDVNSTDVNSATFSFNRGMTSGPTAATDSTTTGNAIASLLLGTGSSGSAPNAARLALSQKYFAWYLADSWKLGRLTLNYGVRYEIQNAATERYNRLNNFATRAINPLSQQTGLNLNGGLEFLDSSNRGLWDTKYNNLAPRVGLSYKITDKLVARAGYGIFFTPAWAGALAADGYSVSTPWVSSVGGGGLVPQDVLSNPFPNGLVQPIGSSLGLSTLTGQGVNAFTRWHPTPYVQSYSIDFQYQLTPTSVVEVGYSGVQGRKLFYGYGLNQNQLDPQYLSMGSALSQQVANPFYGIITTGSLAGKTIPRSQLLLPYPQFTSVNLSGLTPGASSSYNALTFKFSRRFSAGLQALVTYQYSKAIDNASETQSWEIGDAQRNVYNLSNERSISGHDIPQDFTASLTYELPVGRGRAFGSNMNRALNAVAGGWQVATTVRAGSGLPLQFTASNALSAYGYSVARPNITSLADLTSGASSPDRWFNTNAVTAPAPYTIGSAPRWISNLRTGPLNSTDLSLMKNFQLTETLKMQFQAQAFNLTNTPQYGRANTTVGSTTFGVVTGTTYVTPRNIQLALRLSF